MKLQLALSLALTGLSACAFAAVTSEEAAELGKSLTPWGAIQAGNAEGTIPVSYTHLDVYKRQTTT